MEPEIAKLPVWATVKESYRLAWVNRGEYFKIVRWWIFLGIPLFTLYNWGAFNFITGTSIKAMLLYSLPAMIFMFVLNASIAVSWHRFILLGEKSAAHYFRRDELVWKYFALSFGLYMISLIPIGLIFLSMLLGSPFSSKMNASQTIIMIAIIPVTIYILSILPRLAIILPARALINIQDLTLKEVLRITKGNSLRIWFCLTLCCILGGLVSSIGGLLPTFSNGFNISKTIFSLLGNILVMQIILTFLSLSYQHFFKPASLSEN